MLTNAPKSAKEVTRPVLMSPTSRPLDDLVADGIAGFMRSGFFGEDQAASFLIDLDNLQGDFFTDHFAEAFLSVFTAEFHAAGIA